MHFTTDHTLYEITGATFTYTAYNYRPNGGSVSNGTMDWGGTSATTNTWTKGGTNPVRSLDITFTRTGVTFRLATFTVTYTDYQWN